MARSIGTLATILTVDPQGAVRGFEAARQAATKYDRDTKAGDYGRDKMKAAEDQATKTADASKRIPQGRKDEGPDQEAKNRDRATAATERWIKSLEREIALYGKTKRERQLYDLEKRGASKETLDRARGLDDQLKKKEAATQAQDKKTAMMDQVSGALGGVPEIAQGLLSKIGPIGAVVAVAVAAAAAAFRLLAKDMAAAQQVAKETGEALHVQARRAEQLNMSAAQLRGFQMAAKKAGIDSDLLETYLMKLSGSLGEVAAGSNEAAANFAAIGLQASEVAGLDLDEAFLRVADQIASLGTHSERTAAAIQIFGARGREMVHVLSQGAAGIRLQTLEAQRLGLVLDDVSQKRITQMIAKQKELAKIQEGENVATALRFAHERYWQAENQIRDIEALRDVTAAYETTLARLADRLNPAEMTRGWKVAWSEFKFQLAEVADSIAALFYRTNPEAPQPWRQALERAERAAAAARDRVREIREEGGDVAGAEREQAVAEAAAARARAQAESDRLEQEQKDLEDRLARATTGTPAREQVTNWLLGLGASSMAPLGPIGPSGLMAGALANRLQQQAEAGGDPHTIRAEMAANAEAQMAAESNKAEAAAQERRQLAIAALKKKFDTDQGEMAARNLQTGDAGGAVDDWDRRQNQAIEQARRAAKTRDEFEAMVSKIRGNFGVEASNAAVDGLARLRREVDNMAQAQRIAADVGVIYDEQLMGLRGSTQQWMETQLAANLAQTRQTEAWKRASPFQRLEMEMAAAAKTEEQRLGLLRASANQTITATLTPGEQIADDLDRLNEQLQLGMMSAEVYNRALAGLADRFDTATQGPAALMQGSAAAISAINRAQRSADRGDPMARLENLMGEELTTERETLEEMRNLARAMEISVADLLD